MTKEDIYDEKISPLMTQILDICQENKIAMIASFSVPGANDEDPINDPLQCTSSLLSEAYDPPKSMLKAIDLLKPPATNPLMLTMTHPDGSQDMIAIL